MQSSRGGRDPVRGFWWLLQGSGPWLSKSGLWAFYQCSQGKGMRKADLQPPQERLAHKGQRNHRPDSNQNPVCQAGLPWSTLPLIKWSVVLVAQSWLTLCDPMDCSPAHSPVHGILLARTLEWVAIPFTRGPSWPRDQTQVFHIGGRFFAVWATRELGVKLLPATCLWAEHKLKGGEWGKQTKFHDMRLWLFFFKYLFIYVWLHRVFTATRRLALVAVSRGYSSSRCTGFSLQWLLLLPTAGSRRAVPSSRSMQHQ